MSELPTEKESYKSRYPVWQPANNRGNVENNFGRERVLNEHRADEDLEDLYIKHGRVIDCSYDKPEVEVEAVEGVEVAQKLRSVEAPEKTSVGRSMGALIGDLHASGFSHGDPHLDNFIYKEGDIGSIDHEYWERNPELERCIRDLKVLRAHAAMTEGFDEFMDGFQEGYRREIGTERYLDKEGYTASLTEFFGSRPDLEELYLFEEKIGEKLESGSYIETAKAATRFLKNI